MCEAAPRCVKAHHQKDAGSKANVRADRPERSAVWASGGSRYLVFVTGRRRANRLHADRLSKQ